MSAVCWCIVLQEDKHVSSDATEYWQQFLHQQHSSMPVDFIDSFSENEVGITEFRYGNRDLTDLLKVGRMRRRRLTLLSCCYSSA